MQIRWSIRSLMLATLTAALFSAGFFLRGLQPGISFASAVCGMFVLIGVGASIGYDLGRTRYAALVGVLWSIWFFWMLWIAHDFIYPPMT